MIAPDARGHGESGKPTDPARYGRNMIDDIERVLDHAHVTKAHVVGFSMGAEAGLVAGGIGAGTGRLVDDDRFGLVRP